MQYSPEEINNIDKQKIRKIYELLPQSNCGLCGFLLCSKFARAVVEGNISPFGCRLKPWAGYKACEVMGLDVPLFGYTSRTSLLPMLGDNPTFEELRDLLGEDP